MTVREEMGLAGDIKIVAARELGASDITRWDARKLKLASRRDYRIVLDTPFKLKAQAGKLITAVVEHKLTGALAGAGLKITKLTCTGKAGLQLITDGHSFANEIFKFVAPGGIHQLKQGVIIHFRSSFGLLSCSTPIEHDKVAQ